MTTAENVETAISLPRDVTALERSVRDVNAAMILLDPLVSRLDARLDTHKDAEVRLALEPLVRLANNTRTTVLGLIHLNKSTATDPLSMLMGSRAFAAVARAVLFVITDPEDETVRLLGQPKNNLGRSDLPTLSYRIESATVADTDEGPVVTGRVVCLGESDRSLTDAIASVAEGGEVRTATKEAADWLSDYLIAEGGSADSATVKREGAKAGHSDSGLKRARRTLSLRVESRGFPRRTHWTIPVGSQSVGRVNLTNLIELTGPPEQPVRAAGPAGPVREALRGTRPDCRICGHPLDPALSDDGTHPTCSGEDAA